MLLIMNKSGSLFRFNSSYLRFSVGFIFIAAIALRSINYFARSSMWLDELASSFNVMERSFYQLATETLDFNQVAPIGFLWLQKLASLVFGMNDHAFRFFPFVFSLLTLPLFYLAGRYFLKGIATVGACALFGLSMSLLFYGAEAKQYSADVTASLFIVWSALRMTKAPLKPASLWMIAAGGFLLILCSMPAVMIAPLALLPVFIALLRKKIQLPFKHFAIIAVSWAVACLILTAYAKLIISAEVQHAMSDYWSGGFAPLTNLGEFLAWIPLRIHKEFSFLLAWYMADLLPQTGYIAWALMLLSVPGLIYSFQQSTIATAVLLTPLLSALLLAMFQLLPFDGRVSVYATWPIVISGMTGIIALNSWLPKVFGPVVSMPLTLILCLPIGLAILGMPSMRPPYNGQSAQPVLKELKRQLQPGDVLYVYFKSRYAMQFYGPKEGITDYVAGRNHQYIEPLLRDIDSLKGNKRVWFFFSQWTPKQPFPDSIKSYMGGIIGKQIGVIPDPDGNTGEIEVAAHLYDLSITTSQQVLTNH
ncbi:MAG: glycosyltransferase family 39 protein [Bacteroidota bacterium]|nr:glycosyltransferase family 39 protein [Bacteroidota bacterium]